MQVSTWKKAMFNRIPEKYHDHLRSPRVRYSFYGFLGFILILVLILWPESTGVKTRALSWAVAAEGPITIDLIESGEIEAVSQHIVSAPRSWSANLQIIKLIPEGQMVKKGDVLGQFDVSSLQNQIDLEKDRLITLNADLDKLLSQQKLTMSNLERSLQLARYSNEQAKLRLEMQKFESEAKQEESRLQLAQSEIELNKINKQLDSQKIIHRSQVIKNEMGIRQIRNRIVSLEERIKWFTLISPAEGMVVYKEVGRWNSRERLKEGYTARPGEELVAIPDMSRMQVKCFINEVDRLKIVPGLQAVIKLDAYPELEFNGSVRQVARLAQKVTFESELKGFLVYIDIEGDDPRMKPGISARVQIILNQYNKVTYIPVGAIFEQDGQSVVFRKGSTKPKPVEMGERNNAYAIIVDGLEPGVELSWFDPRESSSMLGLAEEKQRIEDIHVDLKESFSIFEDRGILYDYVAETSETSDDDTKMTKAKVDLNKLPPSIRARLQKEQNAGQTEKPKLEESGQDEKGKKGVFRVSPEMMKRPQNKKSDDK
ncbi:hypothetical protein BVY01_04225 [bacterium I07]|nr:hypothetical protein BVY01_04225 [bacterium I07]